MTNVTLVSLDKFTAILNVWQILLSFISMMIMAMVRRIFVESSYKTSRRVAGIQCAIALAISRNAYGSSKYRMRKVYVTSDEL